ncbi:MAG: sigma 54-interacting transcriptional regulator [Planctomycetota bacterium]
MPKLIVLEQGQKTVYNLTRDVTTIGRAPESHVPLRDTRASRSHARVERKGDDFQIIDEGSQNGTCVNGSFVQRRGLKVGDLVEIGGVRIFFDKVDDRKLKRGAFQSTQAEMAEAERGFLILVSGDEMEFEVARNFAKEEVAEPEFHISRTIAEKVLATGETLLAVNALEDERFKEIHSISAMGLRSVLCLPLSSKGKVTGALYIDNRLQKGVFAPEHLRMLEALGAQAATAIEHARLFGELQVKQKELIEANRRVEKLNRVLKDRVDKQQIELTRMQDELSTRQTEFEHRYDYANIVGRSGAMQEVFKRLDRIIPTEMPVLVQGESGTGKELVAKAIHYMGPRKKKKFVSENCAALPENLLEAELFGYMKGAFTGASRDKKGLFEEAHGGTLFLDEVGEMSREMQKRLLRVLQEKEIRPVGGKDTIPVDVRIISASNRDLGKLVEKGEFREDLFYRLRVLTVDLPPLRDRKEDIPLLVAHFFEHYEKKGEKVPQRIEPAVLDALAAYDFRGNVRELENEVRRLIALSDKVVTLGSLSEQIRSGRDRGAESWDESEIRALEDQVRDLEVREIRRALAATDGNKTRAAELLGISRFTLQRKLEKYGMDSPD